MTAFILLSDITAVDCPTKLAPLKYTNDLSLMPPVGAMGEFFDKEASTQGPASGHLIYKTDVLHRGSESGASQRSRLVMSVNFREWRARSNRRPVASFGTRPRSPSRSQTLRPSRGNSIRALRMTHCTRPSSGNNGTACSRNSGRSFPVPRSRRLTD